MSKRSSFWNWLGLAAVLLLVVALILLSRGGEGAAELAPAERSSPLAALASPLSAHESPLAVALTSPLPAAQVTPTPSPSPTLPAPTATAAASDLELTLVHSNDTWGYLLPCG